MTGRERQGAPSERPRSTGYTLLELIVVASLSAVLLSISVTAYYNWTRSTTSDTALTELGAALTRARGHAIARQRVTRVSMVPGPRGAVVSTERLLDGRGDDWRPIAPSNRLDWTSSSEETVYFRPDGSCCLDREEVDGPASEQDTYAIDLENIPGRGSKARGRFRSILLDPRSGLHKIKGRNYDDDGR